MSFMAAALHAPDSDRSYSDAWAGVHARFADEDAKRRAWLDAQVRRRTAAPACAWKGTLTDDQVREIRRRAAAGESFASIGKDVGLDRSSARLIATGDSYRWVR